MENILVPLLKLVMENPSFNIGVSLATLALVGLIWKYTILNMSKKLKDLENKLDTHCKESTERGIQTESIKDGVMELKGLVAGMGIRREVK